MSKCTGQHDVTFCGDCALIWQRRARQSKAELAKVRDEVNYLATNLTICREELAAAREALRERLSPEWGLRTPEGAVRVEAYLHKGEVIVLAGIRQLPESHDCDEMGCGTFSHVLYRAALGGEQPGD